MTGIPAWVSLAAGLWLAAAAAHAQGPAPAGAEPGGAQEFSTAERLLLMSNQMAGIKPGAPLRYRFEHSGSRDAAWQDDARIELVQRADGSCCAAKGEFLSGGRAVTQPDIDNAEGNPVVLYFLERDIRDMKEATKGATAYFRKRIRMALFQSAQVQPATARYEGKAVSAQQITLTPYENDPNGSRFPAYLAKRYVFTLSPDVPGGIVQMRATAPGASPDTPLVDDVLTLQGATLP